MQRFERVDDELVLPLVPPDERDQVAMLWKIDARLGEIARSGKEPALRQIRLKWWEDQLAGLTPEARPPEPLLTQTAQILCPAIGGDRLASLAAAWAEAAISDDPLAGQSRGRALFALTADLLGAQPGASIALAGGAWAGVDTLLARDTPRGDSSWRAAYRAFGAVRLGRIVRPLAAVSGVARRIARHDGARSPGAEQWTVFRIGLIGR